MGHLVPRRFARRATHASERGSAPCCAERGSDVHLGRGGGGHVRCLAHELRRVSLSTDCLCIVPQPSPPSSDHIHTTGTGHDRSQPWALSAVERVAV